LLLLDKNPDSPARGEIVSAEQLNELVDTGNRRHQKTLCFSWIDADDDWLLVETDPMIET
jgi:hypothetical protein